MKNVNNHECAQSVLSEIPDMPVHAHLVMIGTIVALIAILIFSKDP